MTKAKINRIWDKNPKEVGLDINSLSKEYLDAVARLMYYDRSKFRKEWIEWCKSKR